MSERLARGGGTSRATRGKEGGRRANGQQMQLLGDAEKASSIRSNKLRLKLGSDRGLKRHTERRVQMRCKAEARGWEQQEAANSPVKRDDKCGPA